MVAGGVSRDYYSRIGSPGSKQQTPTRGRACPAIACLLRRRRSPVFENQAHYIRSDPPSLGLRCYSWSCRGRSRLCPSRCPTQGKRPRPACGTIRPGLLATTLVPLSATEPRLRRSPLARDDPFT
jgi:hypothetical protein